MILLVEDGPDDAELIRSGLYRAWVDGRVVVVRTGEEAIAYVKGIGPYADRAAFPLPWLILLDLGLPGMTGLDVLKWLRNEPRTRYVPVVVLTGWADRSTIQRAYRAGANSFVLKDVENLLTNAREIAKYWLEMALLPQPEQGSGVQESAEAPAAVSAEPGA